MSLDDWAIISEGADGELTTIDQHADEVRGREGRPRRWLRGRTRSPSRVRSVSPEWPSVRVSARSPVLSTRAASRTRTSRVSGGSTQGGRMLLILTVPGSSPTVSARRSTRSRAQGLRPAPRVGRRRLVGEHAHDAIAEYRRRTRPDVGRGSPPRFPTRPVAGLPRCPAERPDPLTPSAASRRLRSRRSPPAVTARTVPRNLRSIPRHPSTPLAGPVAPRGPAASRPDRRPSRDRPRPRSSRLVDIRAVGDRDWPGLIRPTSASRWMRP